MEGTELDRVTDKAASRQPAPQKGMPRVDPAARPVGRGSLSQWFPGAGEGPPRQDAQLSLAKPRPTVVPGGCAHANV